MTASGSGPSRPTFLRMRRAPPLSFMHSAAGRLPSGGRLGALQGSNSSTGGGSKVSTTLR